MTNLQKIDRFKDIYTRALDVNCERFPEWDQTRVFEVEGALRVACHYLTEVISKPITESDLELIEMLLKAQIELSILPDYKWVKGNKSKRTSNSELAAFTGLQYLQRCTIRRTLDLNTAFNNLYPTTKLKPITYDLYKSFDSTNLKLYNLFKPFFDKDNLNQLYRGAGLNFDEKGLQYTNGHCLIRIHSNYVKTLPDKREIYENSGLDKGCFIYEKKEFKPHKFPYNHENMVKKLPLTAEAFVSINQPQLEKLILLLEQMEYFNAQSVSESVTLIVGEAKLEVKLSYLKDILHILSTEGNGMQFSVRKLIKEKGVVSWQSLVVSPDLVKFTELEASGALLMPIHSSGNVFKVDVNTQQLSIIT